MKVSVFSVNNNRKRMKVKLKNKVNYIFQLLFAVYLINNMHFGRMNLLIFGEK